MRIVDQALEQPGQCELTGRIGGPFVQTDRLIHPAVQRGGTQYVSFAAIDELVVAYGGYTPHQVGAAEEHMQALQRQLDAQQAELTELRELRAAIGMTLKHGAVANRGEVQLRKPRAADLQRGV